MISGNRDKSKQGYASLFDFLFYRPVSKLTELLTYNGDNKSPKDSFSIGTSQSLYNRTKQETIYLRMSQLLRHTYILGHSGSGKTFLILLMLMNFVKNRSGFCVVDIHGDLSRMIFNFLTSQAYNSNKETEVFKRLVLIEPFNKKYAPSFNPLSCTNRNNLYSEAYEMLGIFKRIWKDVSWGARMDELLRNLLITLSLTKRSLAEAPLFLTDESFRANTLAHLNDYEAKFYWTDRFGALSDRMKPMYIEPVLNKLTVFTSDPYIRHILAQKETKIDFRRFMDEQKWVIINISKGTLSENAHLLGSLFISKIKAAALSRTNIPESRRVPFYLVVDEFQNFMGYNFEEILSEARKYKLGLVLAHQNLAQIERSMRESIFGNVYNNLFFKLSHNDTREVSNAFTGRDKALLHQSLLTLNVGEAICRVPDGTFRRTKIHHINPNHENKSISDKLRLACYERYYKARSTIESELRSSRADSNATIISRNSRKVRYQSRRIVNNGIEEGIL